MKTRLYIFLILFTLSACSSTPKSTVDMSRVGEEDIVQRYGKNDDLKQAEQFKIEGGIVVATGSATIPADNGRPEAAVKLAQAQARSTLAKTVENRIDSFLQVASENTSQDSQEMRELISEVSKLTANELKPGKTYYEKVKVYGDSGLPHTEYRAWAQVEINEQQFKHHVVDSMRRQEGKLGMSEEFHKSVSQHWDKMLVGDDQQKMGADKSAEERKPSSIEAKPTAPDVKPASN